MFEKVKCKICESTRVAKLRIDSDWCGSVGSFSLINDKTEYTETDISEIEMFNRPDIDVFYCFKCMAMYE